MQQAIVKPQRIIPTKAVYILIIAFVTFTTSTSLAQPDSLWSNIYGGPGHEHCSDMISANGGGFALVGSYDGRYLDISVSTFCLVKTDSLGQQEWLRYWDQFIRSGRSLVQTSDNGFIMVGTSGWILKIDSMGELEWSRHYENIVMFDKIKSLTDSTYIISGHGDSPDDDQDVLLFKIDNEGNTLWRRHYGTENREWCHDVDLTFDGGFILAGASSWQGERGTDGIAIKVDSEGELEWENSYGVEGDYVFVEVAQMPDSGYVFVGFHVNPEGCYRYYAVRIDADGEEIWARTPNDNYGQGYSVAVTPDNGIILAGGAQEQNEEDRYKDFCLIRLDFNGEKLYQKNFGNDYSMGQECTSIIRMPDGGYALGGQGGRVRDNWEQMNTNFWLMRTGPDIIRWLALPDTNFVLGDTLTIELDWFNQFISPISYLDSALTLEVTSGELVNAFIVDNSLLIYCDSAHYESGVTDSIRLVIYETDNEDNFHETWIDVTINEPNSVEVPIIPPPAYILHPAYPNPFNSSVRIDYTIDNPKNVSLKVYDLSGRVVATLLRDKSKPGNHSVVWQADDIPTGIYLCCLESSQKTKIRKLTLIR